MMTRDEVLINPMSTKPILSKIPKKMCKKTAHFLITTAGALIFGAGVVSNIGVLGVVGVIEVSHKFFEKYFPQESHKYTLEMNNKIQYCVQQILKERLILNISDVSYTEAQEIYELALEKTKSLV